MPLVYETMLEGLHESLKNTENLTMKDVDKEFSRRFIDKRIFHNKLGNIIVLTLTIVAIAISKFHFDLTWYYIVIVAIMTMFLSGVIFIRIPNIYFDSLQIMFDSLIASTSMAEGQLLKVANDKSLSDITHSKLRIILKSNENQTEIHSFNCRPFIAVPRVGDFIHLYGLEIELNLSENMDLVEKLKKNHEKIFEKSFEVIKVTWHPFTEKRNVVIILKDPEVQWKDDGVDI